MVIDLKNKTKIKNETKIKNKIKENQKYLNEIDKIISKVMNDPQLPKKMREYQQKYGTMTPEDLRKQFII